jgi:hypothetical protein
MNDTSLSPSAYRTVSVPSSTTGPTSMSVHGGGGGGGGTSGPSFPRPRSPHPLLPSLCSGEKPMAGCAGPGTRFPSAHGECSFLILSKETHP